MANESQLAFIISHALYVGSVYGTHNKKDDFDEQEFKNYARGMLKIACLEAFGADADSFGFTVFYSLYRLKIR